MMVSFSRAEEVGRFEAEEDRAFEAEDFDDLGVECFDAARAAGCATFFFAAAFFFGAGPFAAGLTFFFVAIG